MALGESFECDDKMGNELSSEAELASPDGAHTLPILQKVIDLSNKIKVMRNTWGLVFLMAAEKFLVCSNYILIKKIMLYIVSIVYKVNF